MIAWMKAGLTVASRWRDRIVLAMVDQGCASSANFLLTILYASWLPLSSFGQYVIVWTVSILVEGFQVSLVMDSLPAIVSRYGRRNRQRIDVAGVWVALTYGAMTSCLIVASIPVAGVWTDHFGLPLLCLAAVNPLQRLYIYLRRLCYIRDRQDAATMASMCYAATLVVCAFTLHALDRLSVSSAVLLWGLANGAAIVVIYAKGAARIQRIAPSTVAWLIRRLWRTGRWLTGSAIGVWLTNWGVFPIVAGMAGVETAGVLRALQNLFTPIIQFNAALNLAILPRVADKIVVMGQQYARTFAMYGTALFAGIVMLYCAVVLGNADAILRLLYHRPEILGATALLAPLACGALVESARQATSMSLLAAGRTRVFFLARLVGIAAFVCLALVLTRFLDFRGVLWASVIADAIAAGVLASELFRIENAKRLAPEAAQPGAATGDDAAGAPFGRAFAPAAVAESRSTR